ncbi:outer membrane beta-barrel protein [Fodinibius salsisoli]|uniref:Outer membrane beta-barrel protein n=1 Tax=Fodinibius salsisoli TaxID=2820877 RepID=A0ABT3PL07_9BACT|nr:outer membrane beta-barrel protein [Fodinibius salsisoli]MCW9706438.1 outer membrane beta-barrel protein [Fodinibius salsisoli]
MKRLLLYLFPLFLASAASAQSTEFSAHLNSGLFSFGGSSATHNSFIILSDVASQTSYTNNPYGTQNSVSYGLALQLQRITSGNLILGTQMGFERLRSEVEITRTIGERKPNALYPSFSGETHLIHHFVNLYPYLGHRFKFPSSMDLDITLGADIAFNTSSREKGEAKAGGNDNIITTDKEQNSPGTDIRLRGQATFYYQQWGFSAGYSYGLHNYTSDYVGIDAETYARFIRMGITYRF